jgi:hypothetical protein
MKESFILCAFAALALAHTIGLLYGGNRLSKFFAIICVIAAAICTTVGGWWEFLFILVICLIGREDITEFENSPTDIIKGTAGICVLMMIADALFGWLEWSTLYRWSIIALAVVGFFAALVNSHRCA